MPSTGCMSAHSLTATAGARSSVEPCVPRLCWQVCNRLYQVTNCEIAVLTGVGWCVCWHAQVDGFFLRRCKQGTVQFVLLKPVMAALTLLLYAAGAYTDGDMSATDG